MINTKIFGAVLGMVLLTSACSPHYKRQSAGYSWDDTPVDIAELVEDACDDLMDDAREVNRKADTLLVVSFADLNDLQRSSPLGRMLGQQCASEIVDEGYHVAEILLAETVYVDPKQGELLLSRDLEQIAARHDASLVVVGTYTASTEQIYVTTKLVRSQDARVLSAQNFSLPVNNETRSLLGSFRD